MERQPLRTPWFANGDSHKEMPEMSCLWEVVESHRVNCESTQRLFATVLFPQGVGCGLKKRSTRVLDQRLAW